MATRLYLTNSAAPYTPATKRGGWEQAGATLARNLGFRPAGTAATASVATGSTGAANDVLWGRWISPGAVAAGTLSGTVQAIVGAVESIATTNAFLYLHIFVTAGDSDTVRGTALSNFVGATEFTTTANGRDSAAQTLTSVAVSVGDRLVVEIGYRSVSADTTARTATLNYGNTGTTDLTSGSTSVTTQPGWIQFSGADGIWAPLLSSITDTFPGATLNSTNWPATGGTVVVSGGTARLDTSAFVAIYSDNGAGPYYQFRDSSFFFEVPALPAGGGYYAGWKIVPDDVSGLMVGTYAHGDGTIGFELNGTPTSITYDPVAHRWWRFRCDGTNVYWDTSPDGSTWTNRRSAAAASWTNYADLKFLFEGGGGGASPDYYQIDNVNTLPIVNGTATVTGAGSVSAAASVVVLGTASVAGAGAVTAVAAQRAGSSVAGAGATSAVATQAAGSTAAAGAGSVTAAAVQTLRAPATVAGLGTVTATAVQRAGSTVAGAGSVTAPVVQVAAATAAGVGAVTASSGGAVSGTASISGIGAVSANAVQAAGSSGAGLGAVSAAVTQRGSATQAGLGAVTAAAVQAATASTAGAGTVTANAGGAVTGTASVTGVGSVTAAATLRAGSSATGAGTVTAAGRITGSASVTGAGSTTAAIRLQAGATVAGLGQVVANVQTVITGTATIAGLGAVAATASGRITPRPNTGTTTRPSSGITPRPFAGTTSRP